MPPSTYHATQSAFFTRQYILTCLSYAKNLPLNAQSIAMRAYSVQQ